MVCRCSSPAVHAQRQASASADSAAYAKTQHTKEVEKLRTELAGLTVNAERFEILEAQQVGPCLVMRVKYPSCRNCVHEGVKVMVFANVTAIEALRWKRIDPHFRGEPDETSKEREAPSPLARFPATEKGWRMAIDIAGGL